MTSLQNSRTPYDLIETKTFEKSFKKALRRHPKSIESVKSEIQKIPARLPGDIVNKFKLIPHTVKKVRYGLKAYRISARKGLRLLYLIHESKRKILPLHIYLKNQIKKEQDVLTATKANIKSILKELN